MFAVATVGLIAASCSDDTKSPAPGIPIDSQLLHTEDGLPILATVPVGEWKLGIAYDPSLSDPLTDWAGCMELVRQCYVTTPGPIDACVRKLPICDASAPMKGGSDCCPGRCISDYGEQRDHGASEKDALTATIRRGDCVAGFAELPKSPEP